MKYERKLIAPEEIRRQEEICGEIFEKVTADGRRPLAMVDTYGCQQNEADSEKLRGYLAEMGYGFTQDEFQADVVVVNTCAVREHAEMRVFGNVGALNHSKKARPSQIVAVCGCMVQQAHIAEKIKKSYPVVDLVFGPHELWRFPELLQQVMQRRKRVFATEKNDGAVAEGIPVRRDGGVKAWLSIMYGCNNFCTYCIVPYVRGREVSRRVDQILAEIDFLSKAKVKEITLLGQNVNAYKGEDGTNFPQLLEKICRHIDQTKSSIKWIRFESSNPNDFSDELIEVIKRNPHVCRGFHIAAQHGNNEILRRMNRKNTREEFVELAGKLRSNLPDCQLVTDLMVGFPGETEEQFKDILSLMEEVKFESAFMYFYNPREGTPAAKYENQIPVEEKKARLQKVIDLQSKHTTEVMSKRIGETIEVLCDIVSRHDESELLGKTEQNERVAFKADKKLIGTFVKVKITGLNGNTFKGELL